MSEILFLKLFRQYIKHHQNSGDHFEKRKSSTINVYNNKYILIHQYLFERGMLNLRAEDFTLGLAKEYFSWLSPRYSHNYAVRVTQICSTVLDFGASEEIISLNRLGALKLRKLPPAKPPYLSPQQIGAFENYTSGLSIRSKASHMAVIQIHTGFDYGDFAEIRRSHVIQHEGERYIVKPRHKNGFEQIIPLHPIVEKILEMYGYKMRLMCNSDYNRELKLVAKDLGIIILKENGKPALNAKGMRKIFCMNKMNNEGYSLEATSAMAGHKSPRTTAEFYAYVNINRVHKEVTSK